ncbi:SRPBCC family protein [Streptomyces formicae]
MAHFQFTRDVPLPPAETFSRLTAWERHADAVPLTRVHVRTPGPTRVGTVFTARSGLGPLGFDDVMEIVAWHPPLGTAPGRCRLEKRGTFVTGWAEIEVYPYDTGSRVIWREDLRVRALPAVFDGALATIATRMFTRAVTHLTTG